MSTGKFAYAGYITFFDREEVIIYGINSTIITVSRDTVLRGKQERDGLWRVLLVKNVVNLNTDTIIVRAPPTYMLPDCTSIEEAGHNVCRLQTVAERV